MRTGLLLMLALVSGTSFSQMDPQAIPVTYPNDPINVKEYHLDNGLTIFLSENHDQPQVFGAIAVKTGGKKDPKDNTGMAHYLEHMLFKGTEDLGTTDYAKEKIHLDEINRLYDELGKTSDAVKRKDIQKKINEESVKAAQYAIPNEMDRMLSEIGAENVNAFTTEEVTAYYNSFPSNQINRWLDIYAHRFQNPVFRLFQSELETVYEEKNIGMDNPMEFAFEKYLQNFYKVHPYGQQTVIGKTEHLKNPSLTAMYNYYNTWYVANNMALILSGDFNADEVFPIIREKFSKLRSAPVPKFPEYKEAEFKGKELLKIRATPIKAGAIGFRIPAANATDSDVMEVILGLLTNSESAGMLDALATEGKLLSGGIFPYVNNDYGAAIFFFIPKIIGQSLKKAEAIMNEQIEKIRKGDFDEKLLESTKVSLIKDYQLNWEHNEDRVLTIGTVFFQEQKWGDYIQFEKKINAVTKVEVVRVANKYFGENRLVMHSKMGSPKKDKLEKPGFEPVIPKQEAHSKYYNEWKEIPAAEAKPAFVDFKKDLQEIQVGDKITLRKVQNPYNGIFTMKIRYGTGKYYNPYLKFVPQYLDICDSKSFTAAEFRRNLFGYGAAMGSYVTDNELVITLEGMDEKMNDILSLVHKHLADILPDEKKMKKISGDIDAELKISKKQASFMAGVLNAYVLLGNNSVYFREISASEFKKLKAQQLIDAFKEARTYEVQINYVGKLSPEQIKSICNTNFPFATALKPKQEKIYLPRKDITENTVYVLNDKKSLQSQLHFFIAGRPLNLEDLSIMYAFNKYFGGDMSSLVFQEIREFRSLAYGTYAQYAAPPRPGQRCYFTGYIGCQADKTIDAINAMNLLIHDMPQKPERWEGVQSSLIQNAQADRPGFRNLIETVENWQYRGFTEDPNRDYIENYKVISFDDVVDFWETDIKKHPMVITVVGNTSSFNIKELEQYGKVIVVKESDIMKK